METIAIEVANSYAEAQTISAPELLSTGLAKGHTSSIENCQKLDYKASVNTEVLHRSI